MKNTTYMASEIETSTDDQAVNETANETNMVFFATTCKFPDGSLGFLKHSKDYSSFRGAVEDEFINPTPPEEIQKLINLQAAYWKGEIPKEQALFYTFAFLTANPEISRCTLETYSDQKTFGIALLFENDFMTYKIAPMPIESWNEHVEGMEKLICRQNYLDRLYRQTCDTFFELNYDLHHATVLDNDKTAAEEAVTRINNSIDLFASIFMKIQNDEAITYQQTVDRMKLLNQFAYDQTREIVLQHGRNHYSG